MALAVLALGLAFYSKPTDLTEHDPINFVRGVIDFNVPAHRPHPPGFPIYIALGKLLSAIFPGPTLALQLVSILATALALVCAWLILLELVPGYNATVLLAVIAAAVSPVVWYYSSAIFSEVPAGALILAGVYAWLRFEKGKGTAAYLLSWFCLAAAVGVRPAVFPPLLPLFVVLFFFSGAGQARVAAGAAVALLTAGLPTLWMILTAGGWQPILAAVRHHANFVATMESEKTVRAAVDTIPALWFSPLGYLFAPGLIYFLIRVFRQHSRQTGVFLTCALVLHAAWVMYTIRPYNMRYWSALFPLLGPACMLGSLLFLIERPRFEKYRRPLEKAAIGILAAVAVMNAAKAFPAVRIQRSSETPLLAAAKFARQYHERHPQLRVRAQLHIAPYLAYAAPGLPFETFLTRGAGPQPGELVIQEFGINPAWKLQKLFHSSRRSNKTVVKLGIMRNFEATVYVADGGSRPQ